MRRNFYEPDHQAFRETVQAFIKREVEPNNEKWEEQGSIDRQAWLAAGQQSLIGLLIPQEYGGGGTTDFRFRCVLMEEFARAGAYDAARQACVALLAQQGLRPTTARRPLRRRGSHPGPVRPGPAGLRRPAPQT